MTNEGTLEPEESIASAAHAAAVTTTKVVKGTLWTLIGQAAPLTASFVCTPILIRLLGSESYGVYVLISLIPVYLQIADIGMGMASTKFGSEAFGSGERVREAELVRTAAVITLCASTPVGLALVLFAPSVAQLLNVPIALQNVAVVCIRIASVTFVLNLLNNVLNTPQLSRLRMDLNSLVVAIPRMVGILLTPLILWMGFGLVGAIGVLFVGTVITLISHVLVSSRLLPELRGLGIAPGAAASMFRFGFSIALATFASLLLVNLEKLVLVRVTDVTTLAHYYVAFTLASMLTLFSASMAQSLIPAFAQLTKSPDHLERLYSTSLRAAIFFVPPVLMVLAAVAQPFFWIWAGRDFGQESTVPFYFLLIGIYADLCAYIPWSVLFAYGRTDVFAKTAWIQIPPYAVLVSVLTYFYGAPGAAVAWSSRAVVNTIVLSLLVRRCTGLRAHLNEHLRIGAAALAVLAFPATGLYLLGSQNLWLIPVVLIPVLVYFWLIWSSVLKGEERERLGGVLKRYTDRPLRYLGVRSGQMPL